MSVKGTAPTTAGGTRLATASALDYRARGSRIPADGSRVQRLALRAAKSTPGLKE
jgi:hypothetical protein